MFGQRLFSFFLAIFVSVCGFGLALLVMSSLVLNANVKDTAAGVIEERPINSSSKGFIEFTYDDPESYDGFVLKNWPPDKSRNVIEYIGGEKKMKQEDSALKFQDCIPDSPTGGPLPWELIIFVKSSPFNSAERFANRNSWFKFKNRFQNILIVNVIGQVSDPFLERRLELEQKIFCDILRIDLEDSYAHIALKTILILKFLQNSEIDFKYAVIVDEDLYLNVPTLRYYVTKASSLPAGGSDLIGYEMRGVLPLGETGETAPLIGKDYRCPKYMFNGPIFPPYMSGSLYLLKHSAIECLFEQALRHPAFHLEDVLISGFLAQNCNFTRSHLPNYYAGEIHLWDQNLSVIPGFHYVPQILKPILHRIISAQKGDYETCKAFGDYCVRDGNIVQSGTNWML